MRTHPELSETSSSIYQVTRQIALAFATFAPRRPQPGFGILDTSVYNTRVRPGDLDIYVHVNNAVYLNMMDSGRAHFIADLDGYKLLNPRGWYPVVAASSVTYRRSPLLGQQAQVRTRIVGWDPRIVYLEQEIYHREQLAARAIIAGRFLAKKGGKVPAPDVMALFDGPTTSPELPADVAGWARAVGVAYRPPSSSSTPEQ